jgi:hypothetical protein
MLGEVSSAGQGMPGRACSIACLGEGCARKAFTPFEVPELPEKVPGRLIRHFAFLIAQCSLFRLVRFSDIA